MSTYDITGSQPLVLFTLNDFRYALPLPAVERVIRTVAITPVPKAPTIVLGIINLGGIVVPVLNIRERFNHPPRVMRLSDHLIIAKAGRRKVALLVDEANGIIHSRAEEFVATETILPMIEYIDGAVKSTDGLVLIHNLECLLSFKEHEEIDSAISESHHNDTSTLQAVEELLE